MSLLVEEIRIILILEVSVKLFCGENASIL